MSAFGGKADMIRKRLMSAYDPKRTSRTRQSSRHGAAHRDSIIGSAWFQERSFPLDDNADEVPSVAMLHF
jgi:hypothetical protein